MGGTCEGQGGAGGDVMFSVRGVFSLPGCLSDSASRCCACSESCPSSSSLDDVESQLVVSD